jgi:hypothetical protein
MGVESLRLFGSGPIPRPASTPENGSSGVAGFPFAQKGRSEEAKVSWSPASDNTYYVTELPSYRVTELPRALP